MRRGRDEWTMHARKLLAARRGGRAVAAESAQQVGGDDRQEAGKCPRQLASSWCTKITFSMIA